ncbi:hypothetical protein [Paenibacillus arenosi]|uniref:Prenylated flavin chaperone LpdD-like domain-containing protein n=1 Tax=Paenibacillus arenosi TaxID=2774142 RepID=A0ABR9ATH3_9BACL|nr:hypothetical protein [Paenibacillus arenosi]MBD8497410.1 hypothetical protein [Paenibacillus arenosi]
MNDKDNLLTLSWEHTISCEVTQLGRDYLIRLSGGIHTHHHHIGAVSTAYYVESVVISDVDECICSVNDTCLTGDEIPISMTTSDTGMKNYKNAGHTGSPEQIYTMTHVVPGHKEAILSEPMALEAAKRLRTTVTVIAGIHYEQLQKHEIDQVVHAAWHVFYKALSVAL